jgi:hypothetical protein
VLKVVAFTLSILENRLKLSNAIIIIWMLALFLAFGIFSNFIDGESLTYNLF